MDDPSIIGHVPPPQNGKLKSTTTLKTVKNVSSLLYAYQDLDLKLTKFEDSVEQLAIVLDRAIQREIDIRRGK